LRDDDLLVAMMASIEEAAGCCHEAGLATAQSACEAVAKGISIIAIG
jgi:hypothetical protein